MKVLVAQLCQTLYDPMDCRPPGSSVHGILQARTLEWVAISFSRGSSQSRDSNLGLLPCRQILYHLSHQGNGYAYKSNTIHRQIFFFCKYLLLDLHMTFLWFFLNTLMKFDNVSICLCIITRVFFFMLFIKLELSFSYYYEAQHLIIYVILVERFSI